MKKMATILKYKTKKGNRYRVRYSFAGIQKSKSFPTLKMAKTYQIKVEHEKQTGIFVPTHRMNVADLLDEWIEFHSVKVRATTLHSYIENIKVIKKTTTINN